MKMVYILTTDPKLVFKTPFGKVNSVNSVRLPYTHNIAKKVSAGKVIISDTPFKKAQHKKK
ncbi:MAG TPA: hypothetical protein ENK70_09275 [Methylophaga sp.]|nr:hypothetical protein [Methylophaga sp.]